MQALSLRDLLIPKVHKFVQSLCIIFCIVHLILCLFFLTESIGYLVVYNLLSCIFYIGMYRILKLDNNDLNKLSFILTSIIIELSTHITLALMAVGTSFEFQHYIYGILIFILFEYYVGNNMKKTTSLLSFVSLNYAVPFIFLTYFHPLYKCSESLRNILFVSNSFLVVFLVIIYVKLFMNIISDFESSLLDIAIYDPLTGIRNRTLLRDITYSKDLLVAILDVDNFKRINDVHGHATGDLVLVHLGNLLQSFEIRYNSLQIMRWGGEEFVVIFKGDKDLFMSILINLHESIRNSYIVSSCIKIRYKVTIGVADASQSDSIEDLISKADICLYEGKTTGKDKIVYRG